MFMTKLTSEAPLITAEAAFSIAFHNGVSGSDLDAGMWDLLDNGVDVT